MANVQADEEIMKAVADVKLGKYEAFEIIRSKYSPLSESMVQSFEKSGSGVHGDLSDEADRALLKAVLSYNCENTDVTFGLYAKICIRNALISARRAKLSRENRENRKRERAVDTSFKKYRVRAFAGLDAEAIMEKMHSVLSGYEYRVLEEYAKGKSVAQIAKELCKNERSVNNALYRIRHKAKMLQSD